MDAYFKNRVEAGWLLARDLQQYRAEKPIVLALPRGGVPVAAEIARALDAPLDLIIVRKIGAPGQPELAVGAIADAEPPQIVRNEELLLKLDIPEDAFAREVAEQQREIERRRNAYLRGRPPLPLDRRTAIVVDDGIATGATTRAALHAAKRRGAARLILAVPVAPAATLAALRPLVDELVCLATPDPFYAIGAHYADFHQIADGEVVALLEDAARHAETAVPR
jgi:predicted phosphoribosyltransferase